MEKRAIKTKLVSREETFRILAVGEALGFPVLLVGPPGTGKTRALLDFAKARYATFEETQKNTFILETDEGTRTSEIKGRPDMKKLFSQTAEYSLVSPIISADYVLINEIDKASSGLRNSLLGIMNEKFLFNGQDKVKCVWKGFVASCNEIPQEEKDSPFWDRFVIKHSISRITKTQMLSYYDNQAKGQPSKEIKVSIPSQAEINALIIDPGKLGKFVDICFNSLSDRTLSYVPAIVAAVSLVYDYSVNKALIKACDLLLGYEKSKELAKHLEPAELTAIRGKIELSATINDYDLVSEHVKSIEDSINALISKGTITKDDATELGKELSFALDNNAVWNMEKIVNVEEI